MTTVPNVRIVAAMGRWCHGLVFAAAFAAGCAAAATPQESMQQSTGDSDLGDGADFAGGVVVSNCMDGGSCTISSNPGDCSMGHAVCSGDVQSCVPDVTTQRCYDGPPTTMNKGVCKPGTQTCIGSLGSCDGQVQPAAVENCFNDLDDDCDGTVNNGCPSTLTTGTPRALTLRGGTASTAFSLRCPANNYAAKIIVYGDDNDTYMSGIDLYCATPTLVRGPSSYTVTEAVSATPLSKKGVVSAGSTSTFDCGTAFVPGWVFNGTADSGGIDQIGMYCAAGSLTLSATNQLTITTTKGAVGGSAGYAFGTAFEDDCAAGEVLIGFDGQLNGSYLTELQAVCAPLQVVYK
jgi:hypothetical protein